VSRVLARTLPATVISAKTPYGMKLPSREVLCSELFQDMTPFVSVKT
jgi:hypothetical protein